MAGKVDNASKPTTRALEYSTFDCTICHKVSFLERQFLLIHIFQEHRQFRKRCACPICPPNSSFVSENWEQFRAHLIARYYPMSKRVASQEEWNQVFCPFATCSDRGPILWKELPRHMKDNHAPSSDFWACPICYEGCNGFALFKTHLHTVHPGLLQTHPRLWPRIEEEEPQFLLACDADVPCERTDFVDIHHLQRHRAVAHVWGQQTACNHPDCGLHPQVFLSPALLLQHIGLQHVVECKQAAHPPNNRPKFESQQDLIYHERWEHGVIHQGTTTQ